MTKITPAELPMMSTSADHRLTHTIFMEVQEGKPYDPDPVNRDQWYDPLDSTMLAIVENNMTESVVAYQGEPITTLAYSLCGNTSAYWIILMGNGFMHPDEIPRGAFLRVPNFAAILKELNKRKPRSSVVKTVLF